MYIIVDKDVAGINFVAYKVKAVTRFMQHFKDIWVVRVVPPMPLVCNLLF